MHAFPKKGFSELQECCQWAAFSCKLLQGCFNCNGPLAQGSVSSSAISLQQLIDLGICQSAWVQKIKETHISAQLSTILVCQFQSSLWDQLKHVSGCTASAFVKATGVPPFFPFFLSFPLLPYQSCKYRKNSLVSLPQAKICFGVCHQDNPTKDCL